MTQAAEFDALANATEEELMMMRTLAILAAGASLLAVSCPSYAADHLFTAVAAGGLSNTPGQESQPFLNELNNPGRPGDEVPGQGSVFQGEDHTVPATDTTTGVKLLKTPPPAQSGTKTVPTGSPSVP
ncbi:hypothetical protein [Bradyrhizobium sp. BR 1432]|uniref:hypothetical protein n=1 Tax=Bradyrhizobium sp. BR 1432 TaxID=3447966 RepID=UPI003EE58842